jgi:hypothetical protein
MSEHQIGRESVVEDKDEVALGGVLMGSELLAHDAASSFQRRH